MHSNVPSLDHSLFMVGVNLGWLFMEDKPVTIPTTADGSVGAFVLTFHSHS